MSALSLFRESLRPAVDLVYPPRCPLCGDAIEQQSGLCLECWSGLIVPSEPSCSTCQRPLPSEQAGARAMCAPCLNDTPKHAGIAAATVYNDTSRQLVLRFKHGRKISLAKMMARLMASRLGTVAADTILVPVPLHRWRLWQRGFNQAALLANELSTLTGAQVCVDGLRRTKATPSLGGLGRKERQRALSGAIAISANAGRLVQGRDVILVDDVLTSGATSEACVRILLKNGANGVKIACFARVLNEAGPSQGLVQKSETPEAARTSGAT